MGNQNIITSPYTAGKERTVILPHNVVVNLPLDPHNCKLNHTALCTVVAALCYEVQELRQEIRRTRDA